jgi:hypothetical protein
MPRHRHFTAESEEQSKEDWVYVDLDKEGNLTQGTETKDQEEYYDKVISSLQTEFNNAWNDCLIHPAIMYHLSKTENYNGWVLYHTSAKEFSAWKSKNTLRKKVKIPKPIVATYDMEKEWDRERLTYMEMNFPNYKPKSINLSIAKKKHPLKRTDGLFKSSNYTYKTQRHKDRYTQSFLDFLEKENLL